MDAALANVAASAGLTTVDSPVNPALVVPPKPAGSMTAASAPLAALRDGGELATPQPSRGGGVPKAAAGETQTNSTAITIESTGAKRDKKNEPLGT